MNLAASSAFRHFITHAPWNADRVWRQLRAVIPERRGVLILDATSFPKQGRRSVAVARQYCGTLGKVANCQVAVTTALWTGVRAWMVGAALYLPAEWLTPEARQRARIPVTVRFQEKWRLALALLRQARAAEFQVTAVLGDADFGDNSTVRQMLHRARLPYALGISSILTVFCAPAPLALAVRAVSAQLPPRAWHVVTWRNGTNRPWKSRFAALRVTPAQRWPHRRRAPEVWLLCERDLGATPRTKHYFVALPSTASLKVVVQLTHQRWAIEQQYQELKSELGLDHFEGRTWPGWQHHAVLTAVAHAYIQRERMRRGAAGLTFPAVRAIVQEIFTALLFAAKPRYMHWMNQAKRALQLRI